MNKNNKNKGKKYAIQLSPELADGLRFLADKSYKTQIGVLSEVLAPMLQIAASYNSFNYWVFQSGDEIRIQFFGKKNQATLINSELLETENEVIEQA